jgi:uncharacterized membrane protein YhaH (DUF805 family)
MNESVAQLIPFTLWVVLSVIPALKLLGRLGKSRWWAALVVVPFLGVVVLLWIVAYARWPRVEQSGYVP